MSHGPSGVFAVRWGARLRLLRKFIRTSVAYEAPPGCGLEQAGPCWLSTMAPSGNGRVQITVRIRKNVYGRQVPMYRVAWEIIKGRPFPAGLVPAHLCRRPLCWNPGHLEPVTSSVNARRGVGRDGRCARGHELPPHIPGVKTVCRTCHPSFLRGAWDPGNESVTVTDDGCRLSTRKPYNALGHIPVRLHHRSVLIHRRAFAFYFGPIPPGMDVGQRCGNRACIARDHLYLRTRSESFRSSAVFMAPAHWARKVKTHCKAGHPFEIINGAKRCRPCERRRELAMKERRRATA